MYVAQFIMILSLLLLFSGWESNRERTHSICELNYSYILTNGCLLFQSYEEAFECIQQATGITDIDQLVSKFIEGVVVLVAVSRPSPSPSDNDSYH